MLRSEVDTILGKVSEVENVAEAVRADLSPEIATLGDGVERYGSVAREGGALHVHANVLGAASRGGILGYFMLVLRISQLRLIQQQLPVPPSH